MIVDIALNRAADRRSLEQAVADGESPERTRELDPQSRELDAGRSAAGLLRSGSDALERRFAAHDEVTNVEITFMGLQICALRTERDPHRTAGNLRIHVRGAGGGVGVVTPD